MQSINKDKKNKKRKLKPFVKVIIFFFFIGIIFVIFYKLNFISPVKSFFQNSFNTVKNLIHHKDSNLESDDISNDDTDVISIFKNRLPSQNLVFASSTLMPNGDAQLFLKNTKNDSGYIYVNTKDNPEEVWTTFASVVIAPPIKNIITDDLINLDYIDLRFKNKVFYKLKNSSSSAYNASSTSTSSTTISTPTSSTTKNILLNHQ